MRPVHADCRHYRGDRPCAPHKRDGVVCASCPVYDPVDTRWLIIKLAAVGDVLRTTAILPALRARHPRAHVSWLTESASLPLLAHNPLVDRALGTRALDLAIVAAERFDVCCCLDLDEEAAAIAARCRCERFYGFRRDERGVLCPGNDSAARWYEMSLWDDKKKANTLSYQRHMLDILELGGGVGKPMLVLTDAERTAAAERLAGVPRPRVGLNLGGGGRWKYKRWTLDGFAALAERLAARHRAVPVLLYGPAERALAAELRARLTTPCFDAGADNELRAFGALIDACDVLVTGDTLAMHLAIARDVPAVVLFGPTSASEIELYGRGEKIVAAVACQCCYLNDCDVRPTCMDTITVDAVEAACARLLAAR